MVADFARSITESVNPCSRSEYLSLKNKSNKQNKCLLISRVTFDFLLRCQVPVDFPLHLFVHGRAVRNSEKQKVEEKPPDLDRIANGAEKERERRLFEVVVLW